MRVAVLGGGIVGLTTAGFVKAGYFRNADITVLASDFDNTVSHVAAGIFRVGTSFCGPNETITRYRYICFPAKIQCNTVNYFILISYINFF